MREDIAKIKIPVTILAATYPYGKEAVQYTYKSQDQKLSNYIIQFVDHAAHFIIYDHADWFITKIKKEL